MARPPMYPTLGAWFCLALACAATRAETIERDWPHSGNGGVTIDNAFGKVEVIGWSEPRVRLRAELATGARLVVKHASESQLALVVNLGDRSSKLHGRDVSGDHGSRLVLHVPRGVAITVTSVSADVEVAGIRNSPMVAIHTVSGDQVLVFNARTARLKSVSGDLIVSGAAASSAVATVSGDVELRDFVGGTDVSLVSGDLRIANSSFGVLDLDSVSGDMDIAAVALPNARWNIESLGGDIELRGVDYARVSVSADTFSGSIHADVQEQQGKVVRAGNRGSKLRTAPPRAQARIAIETFSGDIRLHREP